MSGPLRCPRVGSLLDSPGKGVATWDVRRRVRSFARKEFCCQFCCQRRLCQRESGPAGPLRICKLEATVGIEPTIGVLQTPALTTWPRRPCAAGAEEGI